MIRKLICLFVCGIFTSRASGLFFGFSWKNLLFLQVEEQSTSCKPKTYHLLSFLWGISVVRLSFFLSPTVICVLFPLPLLLMSPEHKALVGKLLHKGNNNNFIEQKLWRQVFAPTHPENLLSGTFFCFWVVVVALGSSFITAGSDTVIFDRIF